MCRAQLILQPTLFDVSLSSWTYKWNNGFFFFYLNYGITCIGMINDLPMNVQTQDFLSMQFECLIVSLGNCFNFRPLLTNYLMPNLLVVNNLVSLLIFFKSLMPKVSLCLFSIFLAKSFLTYRKVTFYGTKIDLFIFFKKRIILWPLSAITFGLLELQLSLNCRSNIKLYSLYICVCVCVCVCV